MNDQIAGKRPGRERREEITLFKLVGAGPEDLAGARLVLERAGT